MALNLPPDIQRIFRLIHSRLDELERRRIPSIAGNSARPGVAVGLGVFGDASDGVQTYDGTTTILGVAPSSGIYRLTRDVYLAHGSSVGPSAVIRTAGWRVFCAGTLTVYGEINASGTSASLGTAGNAGHTPDSPAGTLPGYYTTSNANGGGGALNGVGSASNSGANISNAVGGRGGNGGSATAGGTGTGTASRTATAPDAASGNLPRSLVHLQLGGTGPAVTKYEAGTGGAGGSSSGAGAQGGGGGGGGCICGVFALRLVNYGAIRANGGNGANGSGTNNAGGGGGGGAGAVFVICGADSTRGTITATGGNGGTPIGTGGTGAGGANGNVIVLMG